MNTLTLALIFGGDKVIQSGKSERERKGQVKGEAAVQRLLECSGGRRSAGGNSQLE